MGIVLDLGNTEARGALSVRLRSAVRTEHKRIIEVIPGVQVAVVDLDGNRRILVGDGWAWTSTR